MSEADNEVLIGDGEELDLNLSASTIPENEYIASAVSKTLSAGSRSRYRSGSQSSSSRPNSPSVSGSQTLSGSGSQPLSGSGSQPLHSSRPNSPSGSGSQPSSKSGSQHLYSSRTNSPSLSQNLIGSGSQPENLSRANSTSGSQNLYRSGSQQSAFRNSPPPNSSTPKGNSSQSKLSHLFSSNFRQNASSPKTPLSESRELSRRRLSLLDPCEDESFESDGDDDPFAFRPETTVDRQAYQPASEEQVKSDLRYHLRTIYKLRLIQKNGSGKRYQCLMCLPNYKLIWASKTTYQHLEKHVVAKHPRQHKTYKELMAKKSGYKRKRSPSPNQSTSDSPKVDHSVSKRIKTPGGGGTPVLSFYSQQDYDEDALIEVVMNMLPFEVCAML